ncbi:MAG: hypothetical protein LBI29_04415 [Rickettsiales bacterium]|nr:hypothetical protein [Rickettsiales bacterium]
MVVKIVCCMRRVFLVGLFVVGLCNGARASGVVNEPTYDEIMMAAEESVKDLRKVVFITNMLYITNIYNSLNRNAESGAWLDVYHNSHGVGGHKDVGINGLVLGIVTQKTKASPDSYSFAHGFFLAYHSIGDIIKSWLPDDYLSEYFTGSPVLEHKEDQVVSFGYSLRNTLTASSYADMAIIYGFRGSSAGVKAVMNSVYGDSSSIKITKNVNDISVALSVGFGYIRKLSNGFSLEPNARANIFILVDDLYKVLVTGHLKSGYYEDEGKNNMVMQLAPGLNMNFSLIDKVDITMFIRYAKNLANQSADIYNVGSLELGANILAFDSLRVGVSFIAFNKENRGFGFTGGIKF